MFNPIELILNVVRRGLRERSAMSRYGAALGFTLAAFALKVVLERFIEQESPFLLFFSAVMFSAWFGGLGAGLLATVLSALLSDYFFLAPTLSLRPGGSGQALRLTIFVIEGVGISLLCEGLRTSRTRSERQKSALRQSEVRHRIFVEEVADYAFMICDANGIITDWNYGAERLFGHTKQQALGQSASFIFTPEDCAAGAPEHELETAKKDGTATAVRWHLRRDNSRVWVNGTVTAVRDEAGALRGFAKVARDETLQREAEERLRDNQKQLRLITDAVPVLIAYIDRNECYRFVNRAYEDWFAQPTANIVGTHIRDTLGEEGYAIARPNLLRALGGEQVTYERLMPYKYGGARYTSGVHIPDVGEDGTVRGVVALVSDITERKRAEDEMAELYQRAQVANRMKDEFLATLSHELRTPLTPIIGWLHMIRSRMLPEAETERGLSVIAKNASLLSGLINDLLDMSAVLSDKIRLDKSPVAIASILRESIDTAQTQAAARRIEIAFEINKASERAMVDGDRTRLLQIFWNLLNNAIKFERDGGRVRVVCEIEDAMCQVRVRDYGIGIAAEFLPHVFEHFRQSDSSSTRSYGGLGLGLALVKSFVEAHGGTIAVESFGENQGTQFTVTLPLLEAKVKRTDAAGKIYDAGYNADSTPTDILAGGESHGARVLVIEDSPDTLEMMGMILRHAGFQIVACEDAFDALRHASTSEFDIVITDIGLPEISGHELIKRLRMLPHFTNVPAIALTGYATTRDAEQALSAGFDAHLAKPVAAADLLAKIDELLDGKPTR
ncbi:MAG: PAS domain S-box protein [Pyrinomonadaceae bacterium MAG19_C2-C3]|nr:PAS domain S-box protein [Pyrinomonadaceae bacterium MAG19_C2-C3]